MNGFETPWDDLKFALECSGDHASSMVFDAMLELIRLGESADDIRQWVDKNVHPLGDW